MRTLRLALRFDGSAYHGWQIQPNAVTVQAKIKAALETLSGRSETVIGCSRTDSGVHAGIFCCSLRTAMALSAQKIPAALNGNLPRDIAVLSCEEMLPDFHAQYHCVAKEYRYYIWNSPQRNPFLEPYAPQASRELDVDLLNAMAKQFIGTHDFAAFCAAGSAVQSTVRTVQACEWRREGSLLTFRIQADGFLYNMVRIIVGTLLESTAQTDIPAMLVSRNRENAGATAPAQGLFLTQVSYADKSFSAEYLPNREGRF